MMTKINLCCLHTLRRWRIQIPSIYFIGLHQRRCEHSDALHTPEKCIPSTSSSDHLIKSNLTTTTTTPTIESSSSSSSLLDMPVWQYIVESIQEVVMTRGDDVDTWRRFCKLWRKHFPVAEVDQLRLLLEEEILSFNTFGKSEERIPHDLHSLPVFLQALCALVQLGEAQLPLIFTDSQSTNKITDLTERTLFTTVIRELRVVIFYLAEERLLYALYATHYHPSENPTESNLNESGKEIMRDLSLFTDSTVERVRDMGVRLTPKELENVILLADAASALLRIDPPIKLMPVLYRLLLPALGACEQLDSFRLAALATALARCADFSDPTNNNDNNNNNNNNDSGKNGGETLRSTAISYTVCSHMHALARALEVQMRASMQHVQDSETKRRQAQLRLLSLKERKELEKQQQQQQQQKKKNEKLEKHNGENADEGILLLENVASVCSALAALRYADKRFWSVVIDYTITSLQSSSSSLSSSSSSLLLQDVRDILFALDHVHQNNGYDRIMSLLVSLHLLEEPIPPPSAVRKAMKVVKGRTASDL
ncbi:uncharacterized protein TM35_000211700 [Trypanosoma theileri]|uniref:Uncharacterized protein n=1 Tax=Trypanosoma theileri TaxID=67003 RepID=A0A1X0NS95_9TRYP|nr:uncharacterized protein TM35_000211700 [Trypanosoma theileri]ORC87564.1 hypothetical protein TM35_000211700 [Trypanosoma theileri]